MIEQRINIWEPYINGEWIAITTNGFVKKNGEAVMGKGTAAQAAQRFPQLPRDLGKLLLEQGNLLYVFFSQRIITFPVKHKWYEKADLKLIEQSVHQLKSVLDLLPHNIRRIYLPRPGCGNGQLSWEEVKPIVEQLDDRVIVVSL